ncbi:Dirigent protein 2, partial [Mucuna pruriens]
PQKLSHLHFFFHDVVGGRNQTAVRVAAAPGTDKSPTQFGAVVMMDDPLTARPDAASKVVGRAQGMYASASQRELGFLMALNFAFTEGKYNGSSLSVLGRNTVASAVREMPVVGGSGLFRFASGYAQARTHSFGELEAVVEYDVYPLTHRRCLGRGIKRETGYNQIKMNPQDKAKTAFITDARAVCYKFLGFMLIERAIEVNPKKCQVVIDVRSPRNIREVQQLARRIMTLTRFLSRSVETAIHFHCIRKSEKFLWIEEYEVAFQNMNTMLGTLPSSPS